MAEDKENQSWWAWLVAGPLIVVYLAPLLILVDGVATLLKQVMGWLKTGVWTPKDFWTGISSYMPFERPQTGWVIPDKLLNYVLDGPRWFWMLVLFFLVYWAVIEGTTWLTKQSEKAKARWDERTVRPLLTYQGKVTVAVLTVWFIVIPTLSSLVWHREDAWWITFMICFLVGLYGNAAYMGWKKWTGRGAKS